MTWMAFGWVYLLCGVGVMLALDDGEYRRGRLVILALALTVVLIWPMFFMFAITASLRSIADGRKRIIKT